MTRTTAPDAQHSIAAQPRTESSITSEDVTGVAGIAGGSLTPADDARSQTSGNFRTAVVQRAKRLAQVKVLSISIDNGSCKAPEGKCVELLSTVRKEVQSSLSSLNVPIHTQEQPIDGAEPATLIVSYQSIGNDAQIHLTLYDRQGALWRDQGNLIYAEVMERSALNTYCEEASTEIIWEIVAAKMQVAKHVLARSSTPVNDVQLRLNAVTAGKEVTQKII